MAAFLLHIHHLKYRECLGAFYTKERLKFTGLLGLFMTLVSATGTYFKTKVPMSRCVIVKNAPIWRDFLDNNFREKAHVLLVQMPLFSVLLWQFYVWKF